MAPAFTSQERATLRALGAIVGSVDFYRTRCVMLEQHLALTQDGPHRAALLRDLLMARQREQQAVLDLRGGAAHLTRLVEVPA